MVWPRTRDRGGLMQRLEMQAVVDTLSEGVVLADRNRRIEFVNASFSRITGYAAAEAVGQSCGFMQGPDTDPAMIAAMSRALESGERFKGQLLNYRRDGERFWNEVSIVPLVADGGGCSGYFGIVRDVSDQRKLEADYQALERHGQYLLDHAQAGIVMHKANTEIVYANRLACELLGVGPDNIIGAINTDPRWGFIDAEGAKLPIEDYPVNAAVRAREVVSNLMIGIRRVSDRKLVWLMCTAYPKLDGDGVPTHVLVTFTDVTELKQAEDALRLSEERLRLVLLGTNDAAWDWNLLTDEIYYSPRWMQMLGYQEGEQAVDSSLWRRLCHPRDRAPIFTFLEGVLAGPQSSYEVEFRLRHKRGHYVPVLSRGYVLRNAQGKAIRISGTNTDLTERKRAQRQIHKLAYYDSLTGLPNRQLLMDLLGTAVATSQRTRQRGALMFIDLDDFKTFNDTQGHAAGDALLRMVARRLRECVRASDVVSRLGGDEFVVVLQGLGEDPEGALLIAEGVARNIRLSLTQPYKVAKRVHHCTISIGIALFEEVPMAADSVLRHADLAMYQAKAAGRNTLRFFDKEMQRIAEERISIEGDLRHALAAHQVSLHGQPQVNALGQVIGAELLMRWQCPRRGWVSPSVFIPIAESTGVILALGRWVMETACQTLGLWARDPVLSQVSLSVNVSVRQFSDPDFLPQVISLLEREHIAPGRLKVEITESLFAEDMSMVVAKMESLRSAGVRLSIDDFGTGYSSLAYLSRMPLDELKIDRSFVSQALTRESDAAIVQIIISLAENLGLSVVAEGVETDAQREFLAQRGCTCFQGYLFSKPLALPDFEAWVRAR